jgi:putative Ca2+/H+ antiporter (TMEM165/GDT1 family)
MSFSTIASTFAAIFLAELGDKTQLATLTLAGGRPAKLEVFIGSAAALVATSAIAVLAGDAIARFIPPVWMKRIAGAAFVVMGALFLWETR